MTLLLEIPICTFLFGIALEKKRVNRVEVGTYRAQFEFAGEGIFFAYESRALIFAKKSLLSQAIFLAPIFDQ